MLRMAIRGLDTGLFSNVNVRGILARPNAHADVNYPLDGVYENSETTVRNGPKRLYEMDRNSQLLSNNRARLEKVRVTEFSQSVALSKGDG